MSLAVGSLQIRRSLESDEGKYECVAENTVGLAISYGANLYVRGILTARSRSFYKSLKTVLCNSLFKSHRRATECHLPYGTTQCYLPPDTGERARFTPARQAGTWFTYPGGIEGWVDLGGWLYTEIIYLSANSHPSHVSNYTPFTRSSWLDKLLYVSYGQASSMFAWCLLDDCFL